MCFYMYSIHCIIRHELIQTVMLLSLLIDDTSLTCDKPAVCPGVNVTCTCTTAHSSILAWSSDEFIGQDGIRLEFASVQPLLTRQNVAGLSTFAVLTDNSDMNGVVVLESELTFVASESSANILSCLNVVRQTLYPIIIPMSSKWSPLSDTHNITIITSIVHIRICRYVHQFPSLPYKLLIGLCNVTNHMMQETVKLLLLPLPFMLQWI